MRHGESDGARPFNSRGGKEVVESAEGSRVGQRVAMRVMAR
jgi:hypothetical protein